MSSTKQKRENPKKVTGLQIQKLMEMPVTARLVLGECKLEIEEILKLGQGSMLVLDTKVKENLKLYINDEEIAKDLRRFELLKAKTVTSSFKK